MAPERPSYGMTKNASTLVVQQIAKDTSSSNMQIVSFHPGAVATEEVARRMGPTDTSDISFDDENLSGHFAVWAASREAEFLHGRFVWAKGDIDEIKAGDIGKKIGKDSNFLKIGIEGLAESMGSPMLSLEELEAVLAKSQGSRKQISSSEHV
ncbi:NAD(P)-binding domain protein [Beauveria brongniartii RCEF 3172]|uniref:NAD(P)-binding domain protein n=1 Tax=Beauveria brongniartii RCEF 3172 TaxID=1081107 RepID=A0A167EVN7_9HYPO|nr:NAD(P)-binding domain protein [Beauveria brongniartii RCEF 3172]